VVKKEVINGSNYLVMIDSNAYALPPKGSEVEFKYNNLKVKVL
jgi:hypothetical protein